MCERVKRSITCETFDPCFVWEKADIRFDALSAGLSEKNQLVDRVSELQKKMEEVRYNIQNDSKSHRTCSVSLWRLL